MRNDGIECGSRPQCMLPIIMRLDNGVMEGDEIWSGVNVLGKR